MGYVIGLMSGTSLDGIDAALVDIQGNGRQSQVRLVDFLTLPFTPAEVDEIMACMDLGQSNVARICSLNFSLGYKFAEAAKAVLARNGISAREVLAIGSHGQTLYHQPKQEGNLVPSTLQVGEPAVIAYETKIPVVSNFRTMDMAAGGQGAPLVPYTEWLLYGDAEKSRLLQNIGGIGNVTLIPKNCGLDEVIAFDTGPGNMVMDEICKLLFNQNYDKDGLLAAKGTLNQGMLSDLLSMPYILEAPPKSTGRELFGKEFVLRLIEKYAHVAPYDLLATATYFTAKSIALNYEAFIFPDYPIDEVIVGGGGSYNKQLMAMLSELLEGKCRVMAQEDCGYSSEAKEAIAFALLANETMNHIPSNVPSATGAKEAVVLGNITII